MSGAKARSSASSPGSAWRRARRCAKSGLATQRGRRLSGRKAATGWPAKVVVRPGCILAGPVFGSPDREQAKHATAAGLSLERANSIVAGGDAQVGVV